MENKYKRFKKGQKIIERMTKKEKNHFNKTGEVKRIRKEEND